MRTLRAWLLGLVLAPLVLCGQNLVPNGSFEDYTSCPTDFSEMDLAIGWSSRRGTGDYFNACDHPDTCGVPVNWFGYQYARTGTGYAGGYCFSADDGNPLDYRECMGVELNTPLVVGQTYHVVLHASLATGNGPNSYMAFACGQLGALFTVAPYSSTQFDDVAGYSQVYTTNVVSDSTGWTEVSGALVADSAYAYLTIGNFFNDATTPWDSISQDGTIGMAYYYFDDICVALDASDCVWPSSVEADAEAELVAYPMPFSDELTIVGLEDGSWTLRLYDTSGRLIRTVTGRAVSGTLICAFPGLSEGAYLLDCTGYGKQPWRRVVRIQTP